MGLMNSNMGVGDLSTRLLGVETGVDVNCRSSEGKTVLHIIVNTIFGQS